MHAHRCLKQTVFLFLDDPLPLPAAAPCSLPPPPHLRTPCIHPSASTSIPQYVRAPAAPPHPFLLTQGFPIPRPSTCPPSSPPLLYQPCPPSPALPLLPPPSPWLSWLRSWPVCPGGKSFGPDPGQQTYGAEQWRPLSVQSANNTPHSS